MDDLDRQLELSVLSGAIGSAARTLDEAGVDVARSIMDGNDFDDMVSRAAAKVGMTQDAARVNAPQRCQRIRIQKIEQGETGRHAIAEQLPLPCRVASRIGASHLMADEIRRQMIDDGITKERDIPFGVIQSPVPQHLEPGAFWPVDEMESPVL